MGTLPLDDSLYDAITHVLLAGVDPVVLEGETSDVAWIYRWSPWPHDFAVIANAGLSSPEELRVGAYLCARRLHFAFAHRVLGKFTSDALTLHPGDPFLSVLNLAAHAALTDDETAWHNLFGSVMLGPSTKRTHIALSTAFAAEQAPAVAVEVALSLARPMAAAGDVVAAYRVASFLRRLGRWNEAFTAIEDATQALVFSAPPEEFGDHMSERLLVERHLITTRNHAVAAAHHQA